MNLQKTIINESLNCWVRKRHCIAKNLINYYRLTRSIKYPVNPRIFKMFPLPATGRDNRSDN